MLLKIDRSKPVPLYRQIIEEIKILINQGALEAGKPLPSSRALAKKLGVNRTTVYQTYEELQAQGYLLSRPGSYNIVQQRRKEAVHSPGRPSLISWEKAASNEARKIYETFRSYSPERPRKSLPSIESAAVISLAALDIDPRLYPLKEFRRAVRESLLNFGRETLQYGTYKGYLPLRQYIARRLRLHGISASEEEILITNGSQQAIDLVIRLLCRPDDRVVIEAPTYANVIPLLEFNKVKIAVIPMKANGMDLAALEKTLTRQKTSFVYTIPNFQNPTGITSSHLHRERMLNICLEHKVPLVEDGFEEDMKYFGKVPLPIKSIDEKNIVIYLGTFSKALFPGLRIGWITADRECIDRITAIKRFSDLTSSNFTQVVLHEFCRQGFYDLHLKRMHRVFRKRMQTALKSMDECFPSSISWTRPLGGYTIWVKMPERVEEDRLQEKLLSSGITVSPGGYYFPQQILRQQASREESRRILGPAKRGALSPVSSEYFRISIARLNEYEIKEGIKRLGKVLQNMFPSAQRKLKGIR